MKEELLAVKVLKEYQNKLRDDRDVLNSMQDSKDEVEKVIQQIDSLRNSINVLESVYKLHASAAIMLFDDTK